MLCSHTLLPAFEHWGLALRFHERNNPGGHIVLKWHCKKCHGWHYWSGGIGPSHASTERRQRRPAHVVYLHNETCDPKDRILLRWDARDLKRWFPDL